MSYFPAWIRKTMWRKMGAGAQVAASQALAAVFGLNTPGAQMALQRGLPENPKFIKYRPQGATSHDILTLERRALRRMSADTKQMHEREKVRVHRQMTCDHPARDLGPLQTGASGIAYRMCNKCNGLLAESVWLRVA